MSLRPRHYVLLVIIIGLFVFNIVKHRHDERARTVQPAQNPLTANAWAAYDKAAALRDAPDAQFKPAFDALRTATEGPDAQQDATHAFTDVVNCKTWLFFYRNPSWKPNATKHVNGCVQYHRDAVS